MSKYVNIRMMLDSIDCETCDFRKVCDEYEEITNDVVCSLIVEKVLKVESQNK